MNTRLSLVQPSKGREASILRPDTFMRGVGDALRHSGGMHAGEAAAKGLGNSLGAGIDCSWSGPGCSWPRYLP